MIRKPIGPISHLVSLEIDIPVMHTLFSQAHFDFSGGFDRGCISPSNALAERKSRGLRIYDQKRKHGEFFFSYSTKNFAEPRDWNFKQYQFDEMDEIGDVNWRGLGLMFEGSSASDIYPR